MKTYEAGGTVYTWDAATGAATATHHVNGDVVSSYLGRCKVEPMTHRDWVLMGDSWALEPLYVGAQGMAILRQAYAKVAA